MAPDVLAVPAYAAVAASGQRLGPGGPELLNMMSTARPMPEESMLAVPPRTSVPRNRRGREVVLRPMVLAGACTTRRALRSRRVASSALILARSSASLSQCRPSVNWPCPDHS